MENCKNFLKIGAKMNLFFLSIVCELFEVPLYFVRYTSKGVCVPTTKMPKSHISVPGFKSWLGLPMFGFMLIRILGRQGQGESALLRHWASNDCYNSRIPAKDLEELD